MERITAILKEPGQQPKRVTIINELNTYYRMFHGFVEFCKVDTDLMIVFRFDEKDNAASKYNLTIDGKEIYGTVIFTGIDADYLPTDITSEATKKIPCLKA